MGTPGTRMLMNPTSLSFQTSTTGSVTGLGTYTAGPSVDFIYSGAATINVTRLDATSIEGTFTFSAMNSTGDTKAVTEGAFAANF